MRTFNEIIIVLGTFFAIIVAIMIPISLIFWQPVNKVTTSAFLIFSNTVILYLCIVSSSVVEILFSYTKFILPDKETIPGCSVLIADAVFFFMSIVSESKPAIPISIFGMALIKQTLDHSEKY